MKTYRNVYLKSNLPRFTGRNPIYYYGKVVTNADKNGALTREFDRNQDLYIGCDCDTPKYSAIIKRSEIKTQKKKKILKIMGKIVNFAENAGSEEIVEKTDVCTTEEVDETIDETLDVPEYNPADDLADADDILSKVARGEAELNELNEDERDVLVHNFNEKNAGIAELSVERPTPEFIDQCKKDFEEYQSEYMTLDYEICDKKHALEYAKWLKLWNEEYAPLPANYWIGNLKFDEVITDIIKKLENNPEDDLTFDYGALTYTYNLMMQPIGFGIKYARWMAENQETYNAILERLGEHTDMVTLIKKKIALLQNRWALACSGFKCNLIFENLEDLKNMDMSANL